MQGRNGVAPGAPVRRRSAGLLPGAGGLGGRGAPVPAIPYSFVAKHHVFRVQGADGGPDVVRPSPQSLIPSSPSTTSSGSKASTAERTWCAPTRNPLFLRRRVPRLSDPRRQRRAGRGAPRPAIPYSFVAGHHVFRGQGADGGPDVVRPSPQSLILSSSSTTPSGAKAPTAGRTWFAPTRNPLFFRRRAPRLPGPRRRRRAGKTAPVLAWPDGRQRLCEEPGANLVGPAPGKRRRCWRGLTVE